MTDSGWFYWLLRFWHFEKLLIFFITAADLLTLSDNANDCQGTPGVRATGPNLLAGVVLSILWTVELLTLTTTAPHQRRTASPSGGLIVVTSMTRGLDPAPPDRGRQHLVMVTFTTGCWEKHSGCSRRLNGPTLVSLRSLRWNWKSSHQTTSQTTSVRIRQTVTINWRAAFTTGLVTTRKIKLWWISIYWAGLLIDGSWFT